MRMLHPAVKSPVFELVRTLILDLEVAGYNCELRVELFKDTARSGSYRCRIWELDNVRLEEALSRSGRPRDVSDDILPVERGSRTKGRYGHFKAASEKKALDTILHDLMDRLNHWTGHKAKLAAR